MSSTTRPSEDDAAIGFGGDLGIVGDEDEGGAGALVVLKQEVENHAAVGGVEVAGGLVGHDDGRLDDEGAGDGDALLLAAGELDGVVVHALGEADGGEELARLADAGTLDVELEWGGARFQAR